MTTAHSFTFPGIAAGEISLKDWAGQPILIVNTASECGFTPQYGGLQHLWDTYKDRGLVVLGVPSNDFGEQEPGSDDEIAAFCSSVYKVTFPMTAKVKVLGPEAHPFYRWIEDTLGEAAAPRWNFHKYLIDANGDLVGAYPSRTLPNDPNLREEIEKQLS